MIRWLAIVLLIIGKQTNPVEIMKNVVMIKSCLNTVNRALRIAVAYRLVMYRSCQKSANAVEVIGNCLLTNGIR